MAEHPTAFNRVLKVGRFSSLLTLSFCGRRKLLALDSAVKANSARHTELPKED
jgi:hypothetical protein